MFQTMGSTESTLEEVPETEIELNTIDIENADKNSQEATIECKSIFWKYSDLFANSVFHQMAPLSSHRLSGCWDFAFLFWVIASMGAMFGALLWKFYMLCNLNTIMTDAASFDTNQVTDGTITLCSSYFNNAIACHLPDLDCSDYRAARGVSFCDNVVAYCSDDVSCVLGSYYQAWDNFAEVAPNFTLWKSITGNSPGWNVASQAAFNFQPSMSITYVTCPNVAVAFVNAMNYTVYIQSIVLAIYFLFRLVLRDGLGILLHKKTWIDLWQNVKPVSDEDLEDAADTTGDKAGDIINHAVSDDDAPQLVNHDDDPKDEASKEQEPKISFEDFKSADLLANKILQIDAPRSAYHLEGCYSWWFIMWVVLGSSSLFVLLMFEFQVLGCTPNTNQMNPYLGLSNPDAYTEFYNSGNNHVCGSYYTYSTYMGSNDPSYVDSKMNLAAYYQSFDSLTLKRPCRIPGMTCADYNNIWAVSCVGERMCNDTEVCEGNALFSVIAFDLTYSKDIFVEYVTCQDPSESLTNAIQYTIYAQIVILSMFFLVRKVYRHGFVALLRSDTWMNLWHNVKPVRDEDKEEKHMEGNNDDTGTEIALPQKTLCCETVKNYANAAADKILETEIPTSAHKLEGYSAWLFIVFIVGGNIIAFALLLHYFLYTACTLSSAIADQENGPNVYNTGDRHICGTFGRGSYYEGRVSGFLVPCRLPTLSCSDYASYNADACASASTFEFVCQEDVVCGDYTRPDLGFLNGTYPDITIEIFYPLGWSSGVVYTYLECLSVSVALTTTIQYLIFGQAFVLATYFLIYTCSKSEEGIFVLLKAKTWLNLYDNVKPVKTDLIDEVKGKIAG